jgi:hypothetical protein
MKIFIAGSMKFAKEMLRAKIELEGNGHEVFAPIDVEKCVSNPNLSEDIEYCIEKDIIRTHFKIIENCDAILVLNHDKNGIKGYVGGNTLMDMGIAHFLNKKIFILNSIPDISCAVEIKIMQPTVLNGDLNKIS